MQENESPMNNLLMQLWAFFYIFSNSNHFNSAGEIRCNLVDRNRTHDESVVTKLKRKDGRWQIALITIMIKTNGSIWFCLRSCSEFFHDTPCRRSGLICVLSIRSIHSFSLLCELIESPLILPKNLIKIGHCWRGCCSQRHQLPQINMFNSSSSHKAFNWRRDKTYKGEEEFALSHGTRVSDHRSSVVQWNRQIEAFRQN
jgi:hypothetical protein